MKMIRSMGMVYKYGLMELVMKDIGDIIKLVVRASFGMLMETYLKDSGRMIKPMGMEYICI